MTGVCNGHSEGCVLPLVVELLPLSVDGYMVGNSEGCVYGCVS